MDRPILTWTSNRTGVKRSSSTSFSDLGASMRRWWPTSSNTGHAQRSVTPPGRWAMTSASKTPGQSRLTATPRCEWTRPPRQSGPPSSAMRPGQSRRPSESSITFPRQCSTLPNASCACLVTSVFIPAAWCCATGPSSTCAQWSGGGCRGAQCSSGTRMIALTLAS